MALRPARENDLPVLAGFLEELFSLEKDFTPATKKQLRGLRLLLQSQTARVLVATRQGEIAGMVTGQLLISTAEGEVALLVEDLFVLARYRKLGVATELLSGIGQWAAKQGARRVQLLADETNEGALSYYRNRNWQKTRLIALRKYLDQGNETCS